MTLGQLLKQARVRAGLSLRDVERLTGISNGYLSQIESDAIKKPDPNHLHALAGTYGGSYAAYMERAGYVVPNAESPIPAHSMLGDLADLTRTELSQVQQFVGFIRASRPAERPQDD